jgi:two-component system phosphate regulon sensor histidine kinase PhoR
MRNIPPNVDGVWGEVADTLNRQRRRHKKSSEKLRTLIRRATKVTESLGQGVVVLKKNRTLDWWNTSAKTLLNLRSGDRGSSIMNLIREPHFIEYINKSEFSGSIRLMSNVQKDILLDLEASFIDGQDIVLVITDVSRLSKLELLKAEFVGNVSHELRTPLTVLRGYLETLEDLPNKNALETKAYEQMAEQVVRMQTLADDLILLSQMEEESQEIQNEEVDIVSMLNSIIDEAKMLSAGRHHFSFESQPLILQEIMEIFERL